jgi:hypothetical protein
MSLDYVLSKSTRTPHRPLTNRMLPTMKSSQITQIRETLSHKGFDLSCSRWRCRCKHIGLRTHLELLRPWIETRHRRAPRRNQDRSTLLLTTNSTPSAATLKLNVDDTIASPRRQTAAPQGLMYKSQQSWTPPPRAHRRHQIDAPPRQGKSWEDLIPWSHCHRHRLDTNEGHLNLDLLGPKPPAADQRTTISHATQCPGGHRCQGRPLALPRGQFHCDIPPLSRDGQS